MVAPLVGAWIEISMLLKEIYGGAASLPSWERGLKYSRHSRLNGTKTSLPSWERGLKYE